MKKEEKRKFYRILADLYLMSREISGFSHPYTQNELCLIGYEFSERKWMPHRSVLYKYIKEAREKRKK